MMRIGIDLGTTFCCVAYIDHIGEPHVIPNAEGGRTTPSVIWFNGTTAIVGAKAEAKKGERNTDPSNIVQFVKRNMGAPIDSVPGSDVTPYPYDLWNGGFKYGPEGMSAIILRKLKLDAIDYFKQKETIEPGLAEDDTSVEAVITVPAYFNDLQRKKTKLAGYAAGLSVQAIINEPTAAALSYPFTDGPGRKRIMVFDLGGGTFDVTILEYDGQNYTVITSDGHHQLGGKDFDALIMEHLRETFVASTGRKVPIERAFEIQTIALDAKFALTEKHEVTATITADGETAYAVLDRADPAGTDDILITDPDALPPFYFESRATNLLSACRSVCERTLRRSGLRWDQINEIVLAGGSCRMPMIPKMLEEISRQVIRPMIPGFDYDTAIAIGAAKFGRSRYLFARQGDA